MAKVKEDFLAKFQTTKNGDIEEAEFKAGDEVTVVQAWEHHFLLKNKDGHFFTVKKDLVEA
jgi:hypothetical protein